MKFFYALHFIYSDMHLHFFYSELKQSCISLLAHFYFMIQFVFLFMKAWYCLPWQFSLFFFFLFSLQWPDSPMSSFVRIIKYTEGRAWYIKAVSVYVYSIPRAGGVNITTRPQLLLRPRSCRATRISILAGKIHVPPKFIKIIKKNKNTGKNVTAEAFFSSLSIPKWPFLSQNWNNTACIHSGLC